jgi:hypothetical protein
VFGSLGHSRNGRQMAPRSAFLRELAASESAALRRKFVCIATRDDNLIVPRSSQLLPDAKHVSLEGTGHLAMIEDPRAWAVVRQELFEPRAMQAIAPVAS